MEENQNWDTANRFVAVIDVMGFKDFVLKNSHEVVLKTMRDLKNVKDTIIDGTNPNMLMKTNLKSVSFSDSIFVFSPSDTAQDLVNILHQCSIMMAVCIRARIPMRCAISHGKITTEFSNSLFFGQPIIDAHLLQDELQIFGAILYHHAESKLNEFLKDEKYKTRLEYATIRYKVPTKNGKINYYCLHWPSVVIETTEKVFFTTTDKLSIEKYYNSITGKPRQYVDNTIEFIEYLILLEKKKQPGIQEFIGPKKN